LTRPTLPFLKRCGRGQAVFDAQFGAELVERGRARRGAPARGGGAGAALCVLPPRTPGFRLALPAAPLACARPVCRSCSGPTTWPIRCEGIVQIRT
jgi:hypothetical protein